MGLEERNGRFYYYEKKRIGDRVCSVYVGSGELAQLAADVTEEEHLCSKMNRKRLTSIREEGREISEAYGNLNRYIRLHVSASLVLEGYRCHKRHWRRRRYPLPEVMPNKKLPKHPVPISVTFGRGNQISAAVDGSVGEDDLNVAVSLIEKCDTSAPAASDLAALLRWVDRDGVMVKAEDLATAVQLKAVSSYKNAFVEETVLAGVRDLMQRMGYEDADAVERLMIMQIGTAWLVLQSEQKNLERITSGTYSLSEAEACDKRVSRASTRFHRALESLEKVRALRRMTEYRARPRMLVKAQREALPRHFGYGEAQPVEDAEFAVVGVSEKNWQSSFGR